MGRGSSQRAAGRLRGRGDRSLCAGLDCWGRRAGGSRVLLLVPLFAVSEVCAGMFGVVMRKERCFVPFVMRVCEGTAVLTDLLPLPCHVQWRFTTLNI